MNYTKGEWKAQKKSTKDAWKWAVIAPIEGLPVLSNVVAWAHLKSDAHLIAAAPDMYEALRKAIKIIEIENLVVPILCKEALAKAEGRSNET